VNKSSGDRILIDFIGNEVDRIKVIRGRTGTIFSRKNDNQSRSRNIILTAFGYLEIDQNVKA